mmetsp:Transcript_78969/g.218563  ORF Transcript_78969/g.218563 Transcript_78969/m.218563 type:complete len:572 (-) Transcript_78969:180-1895(-)
MGGSSHYSQAMPRQMQPNMYPYQLVNEQGLVHRPGSFGYGPLSFNAQGPQGAFASRALQGALVSKAPQGALVSMASGGMQMMEPMPLGHQLSFDDDKNARAQHQHGSFCCTTCCFQVSFFIFLAFSVALFHLYSYIVGISNIEIHGTQFTFWNYALPQLRFFIAGQWDTVSMTEWYSELADPTDPLVGIGPGPNTRTYYSYWTVKSMLKGLALQIKLGTMERANEMGMQILRDDMWPETGRILFGFDNSDHATVRPYLAEVLDGAERPVDACDGSACWNAAWLRSAFRERLAGLTALSSDDIQWLMAIVLHKVHLNIELRDDEAKGFAEFQQSLRSVVPFPRDSFWESVLGSFPSDLRKQYVANYKAAILRKWPHEDWTVVPVKVVLLSNAMLDSIALHAGSVVSAALQYLLALLYMGGEPGNALRRPLDAQDEAGIQDLVWETLRRYPPVAGVPFWSENEQQTAWTHEIPNLQQALQDPSVFPNPLEFRPGRPGLNHANNSLSIGFADFAFADNDVSNQDSHACPGKNLTLAILQAFLQEFSKYSWVADDTNIKFNSYSTDSFTLRKLQR